MLTTVASANPKKIYLDYAATTPLEPLVLAAMLPYFSAEYANPSSMHESGRRAKQAITRARLDIAELLNCAPDELIFTGSGTESDNLAMQGVARAYRAEGKHIIVSAIEHKAVLESAHALRRDGFEVDILPVDTFGRIDVDECLRLVRPTTTLISVMYANNEIGTILPIVELATALKKFRAGDRALPLLHTDACQAAGFLPLDVQELGVDLMTLNSSKIYGPKGVGMLYKKRGVRIQPLIVGGEQEMNLRAGTESVPLIVGMSVALKKVMEWRQEESARLTALRDYFIERLLTEIPGAILNGHPSERLPNNIHISIPYVEGEAILLMLDRQGIEASTGSACSAFDLKPSHVLMAIGQNAEFAHGSIRFSLGKETTRQEIDQVMVTFPPIIERLRSVSALTAKIHVRV